MRIALALLLVGCVAPSSSPDPGTDTEIGDDTGSGSDPGSGSGTGSDPGSGSGTGTGSGSDTQPAAPVASGTYLVRSQIDLTVEALLPEPAETIVVTLRDFSTNPAHTLLDLAEEMGVPAVAELRAALPSYVEGKLEGWIDGEIEKIVVNGVPVTQIAGEIAALAETALTQFALDSELAISSTTATHTLTAIDLAPAGIDVRVALDAVPDAIVTATASCSSAQGMLAIGDHAYALEYGEYMWSAVNQAVIAQYGTDVRGVIAGAVDCPALAHAIAAKCYYGYCVGHEAQLTQICEAGIDEVVERAHDKAAALRFDALHLAAGTATLVDADDDGAIEALDAGVWTAEINAGMGLRPVPATFTATR